MQQRTWTWSAYTSLLLALKPWKALAVLPLGALDSSFSGMT
jgi:hypothetical protein